MKKNALFLFIGIAISISSCNVAKNAWVSWDVTPAGKDSTILTLCANAKVANKAALSFQGSKSNKMEGLRNGAIATTGNAKVVNRGSVTSVILKY